MLMQLMETVYGSTSPSSLMGASLKEIIPSHLIEELQAKLCSYSLSSEHR